MADKGASSKGAGKPRSSHRSRVSVQSKAVSGNTSQQKKELLLAKLEQKRNRDKLKHHCAYEKSSKVGRKQICDENRKKVCMMEEDSNYVDFLLAR